MAALRPGLRWLLMSTVGVSAAALLWPEGEANRIVAVATREPALPTATVLQGTSPADEATPRSLPSELPAHLLDKADFDPFAGVQPAAPPVTAAAPAPKPFVGPLYVPPPPPPTLNYRYLGQLLDPDGHRQVYLARPDKDVLVAVGTHLDEGYVVEAIDEQGVRLRYPPLNAQAIVPIPTAHDAVAAGPAPTPP